MSLKSIRRAAKTPNKPQAHLLRYQKQAISIGISEQLKMAVIMFAMWLGTTFVVLDSNKTSMWLAVTVACFLIFLSYFIAVIRRILIFRQLDKIKYASEETVTVQCTKVRFLLHPVSKYTLLILCIILKDEHSNWFYYIYPLQTAPNDSSKKAIKEQLLGKTVKLICYRNTKFIKSLP